MIVTVTPNPAIDLTYEVPRLVLGESHRVGVAHPRAGGKGLNVARVLHGQGHLAVVVAPVGGGLGRLVVEDLEEAGIPHRLVEVDAETRRTVAIVDRAGNVTTIFNEEGRPLRESDWSALKAETDRCLRSTPPEAGGQRTVAVGAGSLPAGSPPEFYADVVQAAHAADAAAIVDTGGAALLIAARAGADLVKPNRTELLQATGQQDVLTAARQLARLGAGLVLVSLGPDGMLMIDRTRPEGHWAARLAEPLDGNPTGAGDAAVAAAAAWFAGRGTDRTDLLRHCVAWSAAAVLTPVAGEISPRHRELAGHVHIDWSG